MRIYNWRQITPAYFRAFALFPALLAASLYALATDAIRNDRGPPDRQFEIVAVVICALIAVGAVVYAVRYPVIWFDIGSTLRYRTLWRLHELDWSEARRIWFESGEEATKSAFFWFRAETHDVLIIEINDYRDMQILVPRRMMPELTTLMAAHPAFRTSPYESDDVAEGDESDQREFDESDFHSPDDDEEADSYDPLDRRL